MSHPVWHFDQALDAAQAFGEYDQSQARHESVRLINARIFQAESDHAAERDA